MSKRDDIIDCYIEIHKEPINKVEVFQYLGSILTLDARRATEKKRFGFGKTAFKKMKNVQTNSRLCIET